MNRWAKVLKVICEEAKGKNLYILEADSDMNWFGLPLKDLCTDSTYSLKDPEIYRMLKGKINEEVKGEGFVALVNPVNMYADIYESSRPLFASSWAKERPFDVTRDSFRLGFFETKEEAVNFFLKVSSRLKEEGISFHLFYR